MGLTDEELAFGAEVERHRAAARVTQEWVSRRVGLGRPKVSEVCSGRFLPSWPVLDALITALGMDRERAVGLWRAAKESRDLRARQDRMARSQRPPDWTVRPTLPAEVRSLLKAQQRMAQDLPYRLPGARSSSLATMYVRQALGSRTDQPQTEQQPRPGPVLDSQGVLHTPAEPRRRLAVRPPSLPVRAALDGHDHLLVTGGPGQGKSTLSLRLSAEIAEAWSADADGNVPLSEPVLPLRLTARDLAARLDMPFSQALAAGVRAQYGPLLRAEVTASLLAERVAGCRWLLLVDGLDEVADGGRRDRLITVLTEWASEPDESPYRIVLTTRPIDSVALVPLQRTVARYELQPFDEAALHRFASHWFADSGDHDAADRFLRQIRAAYLDELVQVPLLATIAAIVFEQHANSPLPDNQYSLYEDYLAFLRSGRAHTPTRLDNVRDPLLEHLGQVRLERDTSLIAAARDWVIAHAGLGEHPTGWHDELATFLTAVGPLVSRGDDVQFLHHSFAEHLAATAKARELPERFAPKHEAFDRLLHAGCLGKRGRHARSVLLHYTRLHPTEADQLLKCLHHGSADQHLLAARLLAWRLPASADTIGAFLTTAKAWAMTTHHRADQILRKVSRAAHYPELTSWLADLMRDTTAPWPSRIEAATALATRLRVTHADDATVLLRTTAGDDMAPVAHRLTAAESLAECAAAERRTAEHQLKSLLTDEYIIPHRQRTAAVVLAGLGPSARDYAVTLLMASLTDVEAPAEEVVESAAGLAEIGTEFYECSVGAFRAVLRDRSCRVQDRIEAAVGLVALSSQHETEAVMALTRMVADQRIEGHERVAAAEGLVEVGSQYRTAASRLLMAMLCEPSVQDHERWNIASALGRLGAEFHAVAAGHLNALISDPRVHSNPVVWAVIGLAELGPEFRMEAARRCREIAEISLVMERDCARVLGTLAGLGAPFRSEAVDRLQTQMANRANGPRPRVFAARQLVNLDPQFHPVAIATLLEVASDSSDPELLCEAWSQLSSLENELRNRAMDGLLEVLRSPAVDPWTLHNAAERIAALDNAELGRVADALARTLGDESRDGFWRNAIIQGLVGLGRPFHRMAVNAFLDLLRLNIGSDLVDVSAFESVGTGLRHELATAVRAIMVELDLKVDQRGRAARLLMRLGGEYTSDVQSALREAATDGFLNAEDRCEAVIVWCHFGGVPAEVERLSGDLAVLTGGTEEWARMILSLASLGADMVPLVRRLMTDADCEQVARGTAASILAKLNVELAGEASTVLRTQLGDPHLQWYQRLELLMELAALDNGARHDVIEALVALACDDRIPADQRGWPAYRLASIAPKFGPQLVSDLRLRVVDDSRTVADRAVAMTWLSSFNGLSSGETVSIASALIHHPAAPPEVRRTVIRYLPVRSRREAQRLLLEDQAVPIDQRVPEVNGYNPANLLPAETEAAVRDVLAAPETRTKERLDAAVALAKLSGRFVAEAVLPLEKLSNRDGAVAEKARVELARLSELARRRILAEAVEFLTDGSRPLRERFRRARTAIEIAPTPMSVMTELIRTVASDERSSDQQRAEALFLLRRVDGLDRLRKLRDNERTTPAGQWLSAKKLTAFAAADRAAAASVLGALAMDASSPPALRWRVAADLAELGHPGRAGAVAALRTLCADGTAPATARAEAAGVLAVIRPDLRREALDFLRDLGDTDEALPRVRVYAVMGRLDTTDAAPALRAMAEEQALGPVPRLRAAEALAGMRRDYREAAAMVARELMHDSAVARHVRVKAARDLAFWSSLCREEAREFLRATR